MINSLEKNLDLAPTDVEPKISYTYLEYFGLAQYGMNWHALMHRVNMKNEEGK